MSANLQREGTAQGGRRFSPHLPESVWSPRRGCPKAAPTRTHVHRCCCIEVCTTSSVPRLESWNANVWLRKVASSNFLSANPSCSLAQSECFQPFGRFLVKVPKGYCCLLFLGPWPRAGNRATLYTGDKRNPAPPFRNSAVIRFSCKYQQTVWF